MVLNPGHILVFKWSSQSLSTYVKVRSPGSVKSIEINMRGGIVQQYRDLGP